MSDERYDDMYEFGKDLAAKLETFMNDYIASAGITQDDDRSAIYDGVYENF